MRLNEHHQLVYIGDRNTSALAEHAINTGHTINWDNASELEDTPLTGIMPRNWTQLLSHRLYLESWYIYKQHTSLNRERGPLPRMYQALIKQ